MTRGAGCLQPHAERDDIWEDASTKGACFVAFTLMETCCLGFEVNERFFKGTMLLGQMQ